MRVFFGGMYTLFPSACRYYTLEDDADSSEDDLLGPTREVG